MKATDTRTDAMGGTDDGCAGCAEMRRATISRRSLLKGAALGAAAVPFAAIAGADVAYAEPGDTTWTGDTLVVLSMRGGFDGLSAIVPLTNEVYGQYAALRPTIAVPQNKLIAFDKGVGAADTYFGMHPAMASLKSWYDSGNFGAVVASGLPNPNRSHFEATDEIEHGVPGSTIRSGWLNRLMGRHHGALKPLTALQVGSNTMPTAFDGDEHPIGLRTADAFKLDGVSSTFTAAKWEAGLEAMSSATLAPVRQATTTTLGALADVASVAAQPLGSGYPNSSLGKALKEAARLIKSPLGVKLITVDVGNWDMHVNLGRWDQSYGWMTSQLKDVADSLAAFAADLEGADKLGQTTLVSISEFGRRAGENDSAGLDHGWGNVMFVLGGSVKGIAGRPFGLAPYNSKTTSNPEQRLSSGGDVVATTDYRAVFAEVLTTRCGASPEDVAGVTGATYAGVFPGYTGTPASYPGIVG